MTSVDASITAQVKSTLFTVIFRRQNVHNNLPEGDSDIVLGPLRFALPAQDAFTERENGDGAT